MRLRSAIHGGGEGARPGSRGDECEWRAIALTHPLAASGTRITIHLLHELRRRGGRFGLGSACIGGGQGGAVVVEAL